MISLTLKFLTFIFCFVDSDFQDVSEKIIEVLHSQILGFSQLSSILNQEKNREGELNDGEIVVRFER